MIVPFTYSEGFISNPAVEASEAKDPAASWWQAPVYIGRYKQVCMSALSESGAFGLNAD
jgi:hypothetical protein